MNRILPYQTENKAKGKAGLVAVVISFDCDFIRAGTVGARVSRD